MTFVLVRLLVLIEKTMDKNEGKYGITFGDIFSLEALQYGSEVDGRRVTGNKYDRDRSCSTRPV